MTGGDWHDPFAEDEAARERERRRAEREARRHERQASLAEKAREGVAQATQASPPTSEERSQATPQPTAEHDGGRPPAPYAPPATPGDGADTGRDALFVRRLLGVLAVAAVVVLLYLLGKEVKDLFADDPQPVADPKPAKTSEFLVPEGLDRRQIAELAEEEGLKGDYAEASERAKGFNPAKYGADRNSDLEGFLFPATYELPKKPTAKDLVARQLQAFEDNIAEVDLSYAKSKNLNVYDVLKIASMVEREIQVPEERRMAAAVIYNRLAAGDTLGIDATIRYEDGNYDEPLTESRLAEDTPYNTRINAGLPPTPIGNPGLASIEAAAKPARSDAYYFVVKPGTCGEHAFVETEKEFARAEDAYQTALEAEGGSPTEC
jgi:UPF0755 protein